MRGPSSSGKVAPADWERCSQLSNGQLEVLRLVNRHLNSKEIASQLGISSHTVDQRVRSAIHRLGVTRRSEAARLVHDFDQARPPAEVSNNLPPEPYQRLIHQPPHIDPTLVADQIGGAVGFQIRHADRTKGVEAAGFNTEQRTFRSQPPLFFPWSTPLQPSNGWSVGKKLVAITTIAIAASFSAGMLLAGLESLARLVHP